MKKTHLFIYILFVVSSAMVLLNRYTPFHLSDYRLHFLFLFCASASLVIIIGHFFNKLKTNRSILITFLFVGSACFMKGFFTWGGDWKTQTQLFENIQNNHKTIDYQLRADRFAFGYKKRVVEIHRLVPGMQWVTDVDTAKVDSELWKKTGVAVQKNNTY